MGSGARRGAANGLSTVGAIYTMWQRPNPLNADLTDLLDGMLRINPAERMTLDAVCQSPWLSDVSAAVFAHDNVVPLAPELWRVRTQLRWARLRRPTQLANAFLRALVDQAEIRADLRPGGPGMQAARAEFQRSMTICGSVGEPPQRLPEPRSEWRRPPAARFRGLSAEDSPPPVVTTLEELGGDGEDGRPPGSRRSREKSEPFRTR